MKRNLRGVGLVFFIFLAIVLFIGLPNQKNGDKPELAETIGPVSDSEKEWSSPLNDFTLVDNKAIYGQDNDARLYKLYVTVLRPTHQGAVTFEELNNYSSAGSDEYLNDSLDPVVEVFFEAETPGAQNLANLQANATMELRGQSQRRARQKSYKIKLFDSTPAWDGFSIINLNKHFNSTLKVENKLAFDYFEMLPDIVSLRTRFVRLYVRDLSLPIPAQTFQDFGLFTLVEQPNKKFLTNHNLDKNGNFYKVENFEFFQYEDALKPIEDTTFNQDKFEKILEVRGSENHRKLVEMLAAVNDYTQDINDVVDKYFDRNNLMTWLAVNIIFDNFDTNSRNFLLYSPLNSNKWFFFPWDYDEMEYQPENRAKWQKGLANYWGMVLFSRMFKDTENVQALGQKIAELSRIINEANTRKLLDSYYGVVTENLLRPPDLDYLRVSPEQYKKQFYTPVKLMEQDKQYFFDSLENPMSFFLGTPKLQDGQYIFTWGASYDLQGDDLIYDFQLSRDPDFKTIVAADKNLHATSYSVRSLQPGEYYWKVVVRDAKGNWQYPFDEFRGDDHITRHGVQKLVLEENPAALGKGEIQ
ncbi:MAG: CotH kinase family protein [Thermincola sp.]|jgi:spore coat protein H|nr:CotH kinase family protein [Thermincola sp.]MDT3704104.1 CotH kinase family protein [Thermincola sp.]